MTMNPQWQCASRILSADTSGSRRTRAFFSAADNSSHGDCRKPMICERSTHDAKAFLSAIDHQRDASLLDFVLDLSRTWLPFGARARSCSRWNDISARSPSGTVSHVARQRRMDRRSGGTALADGNGNLVECADDIAGCVETGNR